MRFRARLLCLCLAFVFAAVPHRGETATLADVISPHVDRGELSGAVVLVTAKDKALSFDAVGYADVGNKKPMRKDTLFWLASTSKPFVGTALMMLVDEGKVRLDDPVANHLPQFTPQLSIKSPDGSESLRRPTRAITLRMLMSHTGGIGWNFPIDALNGGAPSLAELVDGYAKAPLLHEPGTTFSYTDADVNTVGRVIEVVSGMSYNEFLRRRLFAPLGMRDTTASPARAQLERLAKLYWMNPTTKQFEPAPIPPQLAAVVSDAPGMRGTPAGGLFSTAVDLEKFCRMLLNSGSFRGRRLLSEGAVREMTRSQLADEAQKTLPQPGGIDGTLSYGIGWGVSLDGAFFHPGFASTDLHFDSTRQIAVIWLLQQADWTTFPIRAEIVKAAAERFLPKGVAEP